MNGVFALYLVGNYQIAIKGNVVYSATLLGMAHEFGRWFGLDHYTGSYPSNTTPLMLSGYTSNCTYQDIGQWLSKDEWYAIYKANQP